MSESDWKEQQLSGLAAVEAVTGLLQRIRTMDPTAGLYEAAELQWWWTAPRPTDEMGQLFWLDEAGVAAAAILTDWGSGLSQVFEETTLVVAFLPSTSPQMIQKVVDRALSRATAAGIEKISVEVDRDDEPMRSLLFARGFKVKEDGIVLCWLDTTKRPPLSPLPDGYRLMSRQQTAELGWPHHMDNPRRPNPEERFDEISLYRPDLDLVIVDADGEPAAYALFWYDPETGGGLVEPVRTHDEHQRRGLARHILTAGVDLLARAGATRVNIGYEPDNPASGHLYRGIGFQPVRQTEVLARTG